jgi:hypothetical protein
MAGGQVSCRALPRKRACPATEAKQPPVGRNVPPEIPASSAVAFPAHLCSVKLHRCAGVENRSCKSPMIPCVCATGYRVFARPIPCVCATENALTPLKSRAFCHYNFLQQRSLQQRKEKTGKFPCQKAGKKAGKKLALRDEKNIPLIVQFIGSDRLPFQKV